MTVTRQSLPPTVQKPTQIITFRITQRSHSSEQRNQASQTGHQSTCETHAQLDSSALALASGSSSSGASRGGSDGRGLGSLLGGVERAEGLDLKGFGGGVDLEEGDGLVSCLNWGS